MANEKLTLQALKDHDKIHPKFKASKGAITPSSSVKDNNEDAPDRRPRTISTSEASQKSTAPTRTGGMNLFKFVAATRAWQRLATKKKQSAQPAKPVIQYENTYRLEPSEEQKFMPSRAERAIKDIFEARLRGITYDAGLCKSLTTELSNLIKNKVKHLECPRYKIVCCVVLMENKDQGVQVASRCIWNPTTDSFATYTYKNSTVIATAYVHGVYFE